MERDSLDREHHQLIQNFKAELEARDICVKAIEALRQMLDSLQSGDQEELRKIFRHSRMFIEELDKHDDS